MYPTPTVFMCKVLGGWTEDTNNSGLQLEVTVAYIPWVVKIVFLKYLNMPVPLSKDSGKYTHDMFWDFFCKMPPQKPGCSDGNLTFRGLGTPVIYQSLVLLFIATDRHMDSIKSDGVPKLSFSDIVRTTKHW